MALLPPGGKMWNARSRRREVAGGAGQASGTKLNGLCASAPEP